MTALSVTCACGTSATACKPAKVLTTLGRTDLAGRAQAAAARLRRPSTVVCVVGEFKQGKSKLINVVRWKSVSAKLKTCNLPAHR